MIGKTLGIGMALGLSLASIAWADDRPAAHSADLVAAISPQDKDASACAQRRGRRGRGGDSADANNPYGDGGSRNQNGQDAPDQSAAAGSGDPRAASGDGAGSGTSSGRAGQGGGDAGGGLQRSDHLDFDDRLIQGQTARAGAVYLFSRPPRDLPELVKLRRSFRTEISRTVLARDPITPAVAEAPPTPPPARGSTPPGRTGTGAGQRGTEAGSQQAGEQTDSGGRTEGREGRGARGRRGGRR